MGELEGTGPAGPAGPAGTAGPLRFGLVGCGVIADTFVQAFEGLAGAELVAVSDIVPQRSARFAQAHGLADAGRLEALVARPDIDVVVVCTPSGLHADIGLAVAAAGKHVVVEKPIDVSLSAAQRLVAGVAAAGVRLHVIFQQRYNPGVRAVKALLDHGTLGLPRFVYASVPWYRDDAYYASAAWRATWELDGGGAFINQGVHYADLVCWLFVPAHVEAARCATLAHNIKVEDVAVALLGFEGGGVGLLEAITLAYPGFPAVIRAHCTNGSFVLQNGELVRLEMRPGAPEGAAAMAGDGAGTPGTGSLKSPLGHRAQLADIVASVREGRPPPVSGEDGLVALKFVLDVYHAAGWGPTRPA